MYFNISVQIAIQNSIQAHNLRKGIDKVHMKYIGQNINRSWKQD